MVNKKGILQFTGRFLIYFLFIGSILTVSVLVNVMGPSPHLYSDSDYKNVAPYSPPSLNTSQYNVILDQHSHTKYSDGSLTVRQNIEWHISMGYNTIIVTDHGTLNNKEDIAAIKTEYFAKGVIIIQGFEWSTSRCHLNFHGIFNWTLGVPGSPTNEQIKEAITEVHRQNGTVTLDHIPWSLNEAGMKNHPTRAQFKEWGIDFIEIVNDDSLIPNVYDNESIAFCKANGIGQITGTDMHRPDDLAAGAVHGWTLLNVTNFTEEAVMNELRAHRTDIIYYSKGLVDHGQYQENPSYTLIKPIAQFGGLFVALWEGSGTGLDVVGVLLYVGYFFVLFIIIEIINALNPRFWEKINAKKTKKE